MAKRYARKHNTSVSATFSRMIRSIAGKSGGGEVAIPPRSLLAKVAGIIALPQDRTVDDVLREALEEKHGGDARPETGT